eukprot:1838643-Prymnesium_polylepis.1
MGCAHSWPEPSAVGHEGAPCLLSSAPAGGTHVFCASDASSVGGWLPTIQKLQKRLRRDPTLEIST